MSKKKKSVFCLLMSAVMIFSTSIAAFAAPVDETRYNNTIMANSVAFISDSGLLTVDNCYKGIKGTTTKGEITTYVEKKILGLFWTRVDIGQPNNQWYDVAYSYYYDCSHTFQLSSHGTYRITVLYVISGSGGEPDTITRTTTQTY
ncbi:MAG: hypothetical protein IKZ82_07920 [Clostridia bacterium]|nr:hypothetical protein [Clostridia bacterium]